MIKYLSDKQDTFAFSKPCLNRIDSHNGEYSLQIIMQEYYGVLYLVPIIFISIVTIYYKSNDDLLQGISKLDVLLKVSVFQRYKDDDLE